MKRDKNRKSVRVTAKLAALLMLLLALPGAALASGGELLPTSHFAPPQAASAPGEAIEGTLVIDGAKADLFDLHKNSLKIDRKALALDTIPALRIDLVQDGTRIIPVQRGPIRGLNLFIVFSQKYSL